MKGLLVTGTDTGVGKTLVACGLARLMRRRGLNVGVMKPVASGASGSDAAIVSQDAVLLKEAAEVEDPLSDVNPIALGPPLAPVPAAEMSASVVDLDRVEAACERLSRLHACMVVEGIGGLLVPLTRGVTVADLANRFALGVLIVSRTTLGTVNHTLLTIEAARRRRLRILGVIFNRLQSGTLGEDEVTGPQEVAKESGVPILGLIPHLGLDVRSDFDMLAETCAQHLQLDTIMGFVEHPSSGSEK
jgi:dethiobiotin synthetase